MHVNVSPVYDWNVKGALSCSLLPPSCVVLFFYIGCDEFNELESNNKNCFRLEEPLPIKNPLDAYIACDIHRSEFKIKMYPRQNSIIEVYPQAQRIFTVNVVRHTYTITCEDTDIDTPVHCGDTPSYS